MRRAFREAISHLVLVALIMSTLSPSLVLADTRVEIPIGRIITCSFPAPVTPKTSTVGQLVVLQVVNEVAVDGVTVIAAGAHVQGEITQAQERGAVGKPGKIGVTLRTVQAVDGTLVPITGNRVIEGEDKQTSSLVITILCCILGLLQRGGPAEIPARATMNATTTTIVTVTVPE